jgi:predicted nicotinamide N-methyase
MGFIPLHQRPPAVLYRLLKRRFSLRKHVVDIGPRQIEFLLPHDMDDMLAQLAGHPPDHPDVQDERLPYWAEIWPSAVALARFLPAWDLPRGDQRTLEIGCGVGLPGIVAASRGANVTWTDYLPDALAFAALNAWRHLGNCPDVQWMDWRDPQLELAADLVLAADVVYETRAFEPLIRLFDALLRPGGAVLLAEPQRSTARGFFGSLSRHGFRDRVITTVRQEIATPVTLHEIRRSPR